MDIVFKIKGKYTIVAVSGMAITIRNEIVITATLSNDKENRPRFAYVNRGKRKEFVLPAGNDLEKHLLFEGHDLPFTVDSETNRFCGDGNLNFVTDKPEDLKSFLQKHCLNPSPAKFKKIFFTGLDRDAVKYPESFQLFAESGE
jgi:hypothetical protein